jgi:hypothetical protein
LSTAPTAARDDSAPSVLTVLREHRDGLDGHALSCTYAPATSMDRVVISDSLPARTSSPRTTVSPGGTATTQTRIRG